MIFRNPLHIVFLFHSLCIMLAFVVTLCYEDCLFRGSILISKLFYLCQKYLQNSCHWGRLQLPFCGYLKHFSSVQVNKYLSHKFMMPGLVGLYYWLWALLIDYICNDWIEHSKLEALWMIIKHDYVTLGPNLYVNVK